MPELEMYVDYATETPDYSGEVWYQDIMSAYQSTRECDEF